MNILKELYYGNIAEISRRTQPIPNPKTDKELLTYEELKEKLPEQLNELFEKFVDLISDRYGKEMEDKYIQGFKTGLLIGIESNKIDL